MSSRRPERAASAQGWQIAIAPLLPFYALTGASSAWGAADECVVRAELRRKAAAACDAKQWSACLAELDDARAVDPDGDTASTVKSLREKAMAGLGR